MREPILQEFIGFKMLESVLVTIKTSPIISKDIPGESFSFIRDVYVVFAYLESKSSFSTPPLPVSVPNVPVVAHYPRILFQKLVGSTDQLDQYIRQCAVFTDQRTAFKQFLGFE
ncbi:hypothetical protein GEMRC1_009057 [Eukaryota sp. GEM-RC1]